MKTSKTLYPATIIVTEAHWDESVSYKVDSRYNIIGMFTLEHLADTYGGAWAMDRDRWSSEVAFKCASGMTNHYYQMDEATRKLAWDLHWDRKNVKVSQNSFRNTLTTS